MRETKIRAVKRSYFEQLGEKGGCTSCSTAAMRAQSELRELSLLQWGRHGKKFLVLGRGWVASSWAGAWRKDGCADYGKEGN